MRECNGSIEQKSAVTCKLPIGARLNHNSADFGALSRRHNIDAICSPRYFVALEIHESDTFVQVARAKLCVSTYCCDATIQEANLTAMAVSHAGEKINDVDVVSYVILGQ